MAAAASLALAMLGGVSASAQAYTYDYRLFMQKEAYWNTRSVAHNFSYISTNSEGSSFPYMCVKLTRTTNAQNYGDVYCNYYGTGHHYAGDTGTYSWGKQQSFLDLNLPYHEEW